MRRPLYRCFIEYTLQPEETVSSGIKRIIDGEVAAGIEHIDSDIDRHETVHEVRKRCKEVRARMFVTDIDDWEAIGEAHGEYFGEIRPATSMLEVSRLINPELLVEIEAVAVVDES